MSPSETSVDDCDEEAASAQTWLKSSGLKPNGSERLRDPKRAMLGDTISKNVFLTVR